MRLVAPFALLGLLLVLVVALDDTPADADLVIVNRADAFTLDPQRQSYLQDFRMSHALYEGLVRWNNADFTIEPAAAGLPRISADRRTYVFEIGPETRWSNGDPLTAHDFRYSWMRLLLPETAADYSNLLFCIEGAEAFWRWRRDRLADYTADPFHVEPARRSEATAALGRRLGGLLDAGDLPEALAEILTPHRDVLRREVAALDPGALDDAPVTRAVFERLGARDLRHAESEWLWQRTAAKFDEIVGVRAPGDRRLEIRLGRPTAYLLDLLCFCVSFPVHRPSVEGWAAEASRDAIVRRDGWHRVEPPPFERCRWVTLDPRTGRLEQRHLWARPGRLVGNGPYVLDEWRYKRDLRLVRNPFFHRPELAASDTIVALTIEDTNTRVLAFETGKVDWLSTVGAEYQADMVAEVERYKTRYAAEIGSMLAGGRSMDEALASLPPPGRGERRNLHVIPTFGTDFYSFNCRPRLGDGRVNPFANAAVRRAFVRAVDKDTIVRRVTRLNEPVVTTLIPPGSIPGYQSPAGLARDPDRARADLAAAGWSDTDGDGLIDDGRGGSFPVVDLLWTTNSPRYRWISLELKAQWERELGVRVELRGTDTKFYKEDLKQGKFMVARGRWYGDYGDPTTFLDLCRSTDGNNDRGFASDAYDAMLERAAAEIDPGRRLELLAGCEALLMQEEVPMLVICQLVELYMYEPGHLRGLSHHPRLTQYLWQMRAGDR